MSTNSNENAHKQMSREEILKQLPDDLHKLGTLKGMTGPPSLEDYKPVSFPTKSNSFLETLWANCKSNPFVPLGMAATVFFLSNGLRQMVKRDTWKSQQMMRGRVLAQGFTIIAIAGGLTLEAYKHNVKEDDKK